MQHGDPIHMEVDSANASAGVTFTLYTAGTATAFTLAATQFIHVTDIMFLHTAGGTFSIVADSDTAGRRIVKGNLDELGGIVSNLVIPYSCPRGVVPKLFAAAGQVTCVLHGYVTEV